MPETFPAAFGMGMLVVAWGITQTFLSTLLLLLWQLTHPRLWRKVVGAHGISLVLSPLAAWLLLQQS